jgi:hypothetical protein
VLVTLLFPLLLLLLVLLLLLLLPHAARPMATARQAASAETVLLAG